MWVGQGSVLLVERGQGGRWDKVIEETLPQTSDELEQERSRFWLKINK